MGCGSINALKDINRAVEFITENYSAQVQEVISFLLSPSQNQKSVNLLLKIIEPQLLKELSRSMMFSLLYCRYNDFLEEELRKECENGRLVRLLCKLGHINERPE